MTLRKLYDIERKLDEAFTAFENARAKAKTEQDERDSFKRIVRALINNEAGGHCGECDTSFPCYTGPTTCIRAPTDSTVGKESSLADGVLGIDGLRYSSDGGVKHIPADD